MDIKNFASGVSNGGAGAADLIAVWSSATVINAYTNFAFDGTTFKLPLDMRMNEDGTAAAQAVIRNRANTGSIAMWGASIDDGGTVEVFGHSHATKPSWTEIGSNGTAYVTVKPGTVVDFASKITVAHASGDSVAMSKAATQGPSLFFNSTNGTTATNDWRIDIDQSTTSLRHLNSSSANILNLSQAGKVTVGASGGSQFHAVNGRGWDITYGNSGVSAYVQLVHTQNTANSGAFFYASVAGGTAFDAGIFFNISSVVDWGIGIDNSASDRLSFSKSTALGTNEYMSISTAGVVTIGTGTSTTHVLNTTVATTASAGAQTLPATPEGFVTININGTDRKIPYYPT